MQAAPSASSSWVCSAWRPCASRAAWPRRRTSMPEEHSGVAAETPGRIAATPVERGTPVAMGAELVRLSGTETDAQLKEAEANAAQIEARLGLTGGGSTDLSAVPEVQNAKAA